MRLSNLATLTQLERNFKKGTVSTVQLLTTLLYLPIIVSCSGALGEGVLGVGLGVRKVCIEKLVDKLSFFFNENIICLP